MTTVKVNANAVLAKLEAQKKAMEDKKRDPSKSPLVKVSENGTINFRAIPYVHNEDPVGEPFAERFYHQIPVPPYTVWCPKENAGKDCALCNFVWDQMKTHKGNKEEVKKWASHLAQLKIFVAGIIRGREEEGVKLFRIGSNKKEMSDKHKSLFELFTKEPEWMDAQEGFDLEIEFEKNQMFGFIPTKGKMVLARRSTPFGNNPSYKDALSLTPNLDEIWEHRTSAEVSEYLSLWAAHVGENNKPAEVSGVGTSVAAEPTNTDAPKPEVVKSESFQSKLDRLEA